MLSKGQKINERYEIVNSIGEGGMANVYLATDNILNRNVAIKVLRGDLSADEKFIRRFEREAQAVSNLSHPNIVEVYDVGIEDGNHYIVMEYINGLTLKQLLQKRETLTLPEVIDIMTQLTDGMAHAHESYIIHRDIKPQNIMIENNGLIKITDFGIAMAINATQITQTNSVMGSVHYLPPEQASGKTATIKSDIYSLGILMYELLTGTVPFKGDNAVEIALKHMKDKIPSITKQNPAIPQSVENILLKATAKNPRNRYNSVREMYNDFVSCLTEEHLKDKKIVFEYPENDIDDTPTQPIITKKPIENTEELVNEITSNEEHNENFDEETDDEFNGEFEEDDEDEFDEEFSEEFEEEPHKRNTLLTALTAFFLILLIAGGIIWLVATKETEDIIVPNLAGLTVEEAEKKLSELGFTSKIHLEKSEKVEAGIVIKTNPREGGTRKPGAEITIYESTGGNYYYLENYIGKEYEKVAEKLKSLKIDVLIKEDNEINKEEYKDKENIITKQEPAYDPNKKVSIDESDTIILYIPYTHNVDEYPDMIAEGWTLNQVIEFTKEKKLNLTVYDKNNFIISSSDYKKYENTLITSQSRAPEDTIVEGVTLSVSIDVEAQENIIKYPNMVTENWSLSDVIAFSTEHNLTLIVYDSNKTIIPSEEHSLYSYESIISQANKAGTQVIKGSSLSVTINSVYIAKIPESESIIPE